MNPRHPSRQTSRTIRIGLISLVSAALLLPAGATAVAGADELTFFPVADSWVDAARPTRNNGTKTQMRVDAVPVLNSYLRFDVQGVSDFSSARLRVFLNSSTKTGLEVRPVADTTWGETTITFENAPPFGDVAATSGPGTSGTYVTLDVTGLVTQNGPVSFALTTTGSTATSLGSRESANDPELIVGAAPPPPPPPPPPGTTFVVSREGTSTTYTATSSTTTFTGSLKSVVESAIAQLNGAGGGSIAFTAGDFDLGVDQFELDGVSNITFSGAGMSSTTIRNFTSAAGDTEPFDIVVGTNLVFRDFTVRAGGALRSTSDALDFDAGTNIVVERVAITESRARGIIFDGKGAGWSATGNVVRDCVISGIPGDGIELLASGQNLIEGCTITNVGGHGIQVTKSSTSAAQPNKKSSDNLIRNNTIDNAGLDGINVNSGDRNQILGNQVTNSSDDTSGRDGIRIGASDSITCDDNSVDLNIATDNQPTKTQSYGLNIASSLCSRTLVGAGNSFAGNRVGPIRDLGTGTIYDAPPPDSTPPQQPTGLVATAVSPCRVDLTWNATTDNIGVTGYRVYRGGSLVGSVDGSTLAFSDTSVLASTAYTYTVDAIDAAGNPSPMSDPASATTPAGSCSNIFTPVADSWVDASQPTANFGTRTQLRVDGSPVVTSYLKFDVQASGPITRATLRIFVNSNHSLGFSVRPVADTTWAETGITASNAPSFGDVAGSSGALTAGTWVEIDVTSLVAGGGLRSLALTTTSSTAMSLASRESGTTAPQLVVESS